MTPKSEKIKKRNADAATQMTPKMTKPKSSVVKKLENDETKSKSFFHPEKLSIKLRILRKTGKR